MTMTTAQRQRLLGSICEGTSTETAAESLGLTLSEVQEASDADPTFRISLHFAQAVRDCYLAQMEAEQE